MMTWRDTLDGIIGLPLEPPSPARDAHWECVGCGRALLVVEKLGCEGPGCCNALCAMCAGPSADLGRVLCGGCLFVVLEGEEPPT